MIKAFLSHSSKDKENYVEVVANKLKKHEIIYDKFSFETGEKTLNEIFKNLSQTDLFVLFISNNSLESEWVKKEILLATDTLKKHLKHFFPIIIDKNIDYKDDRIPELFRKEYNLKYISKPTVIAKRIRQKLKEISYIRNNTLNLKNNLCIGRNEILEKFEERIDDFDKEHPICIFATGFPSIGRRTVIKHGLEKTNIIDKYYEPNNILLNNNDSIEDFILKLNDFGFLNIDDEIKDLIETTMDDKVKIAIKFIKVIQDLNEKIIILDNGCIVNHERNIATWFMDIINSNEIEEKITFCIASKYKIGYKLLAKENKIFSIQVDELNLSERKRLFKRLLELNNINLSKDDFNYFVKIFYGFPEQIYYCVEYIRQSNVEHVKNNIHEIREFNDEKASILIQHYSSNEDILSFIRLLAQFEIISLDFIFNIVDKEKYYKIIEQLVTENICEFFGYDGQYVRLNDIIRDYIIRYKLKIDEDYLKKIESYIKDFIKKDNIFEEDSSDYLYIVKEAIINNYSIDDNLLLPSHFLRTMKDLYYDRQYKRVIELADKVLEKEEYIDKYLVNDIRYYLCLALAKLKNKKVLEEVQKINGEQHDFILGYYYRLVGRYNEAIKRLNNIKNSKYIQSRARREIVHIYIQTEGYAQALEYAKNNYLENKNNIYHTQLYFACLIHSDNYKDYEDEIKRLVDKLKKLSLEVNFDMGDRSEALYYAKCKHNRTTAYNIIEDARVKFPRSHYVLLTKYDIGFIFRDIKIMQEAITELESFRNIEPKTYNKQKSYLIALEEQNSIKAKELIIDDLNNYPDEAKKQILEKIDKLSNKTLERNI